MSEQIGIGTVLVATLPNRKAYEYTITDQTRGSWITRCGIKVDKSTMKGRGNREAGRRFYTRQQIADMRRMQELQTALRNATAHHVIGQYTAEQMEQALTALGVNIDETPA